MSDQKIESHPRDAAAGVGDTITIDNIDTSYSHWFLGVEFLDSSNNTLAAASAGTVTITIETWVSPGVTQLPATSSIDCTAPVTIDWSPAVTKITATPSALAGVDSWRVKAQGFRS